MQRVDKKRFVLAAKFFLEEGVSAQGARNPVEIGEAKADGRWIQNAVLAILIATPEDQMAQWIQDIELNFRYWE